MANLTFKTNLVPASSNGYALGSSTRLWKVYGDLTGTADYAITAGSATTAGNATYSNCANHAIHAGSATYATTAGNAAYSACADHAIHAGSATYATTASAAGIAEHVSQSLTIGPKVYNGTTAIEIAIGDLGLTSAVTFLGVTTVDVGTTANSATNPVPLTSGGSATAVNGSVVLVKDTGLEYIYSGTVWEELGLATSYALASHLHGNISNTGRVSTYETVTAGDRLLIADESASNKVTGGPAFGDSTSLFLCNNGSWGSIAYASSATYAAYSNCADHATHAGSATFATTASNAIIAGTAEYAISAGSASYATTALYCVNMPDMSDYVTIDTNQTITGAKTMNADLTLAQNLIGTVNKNYGGTLPLVGTEGQIFFQTSQPYYELPAGGIAGQCLIKNSNNDRDVKWSEPPSLSNFVLKTGDTMTGNLTISKNSGDVDIIAQRSDIENGAVALEFGGSGVNHGVWSFKVSKWIIYCDGSVARSQLPIYGAVWNDYAEFRKDNLIQKHLQEPGRCVREVGDGTLILTDGRLQRGCEIISDTFGFAIGQDEENGYNTPIASNGRVLAYCYEGREIAKNFIGWPVCSGPNGTISIMSEEEENRYPSRIIGTISEIPEYEEWGSGKVKVNDRIWIRVR